MPLLDPATLGPGSRLPMPLYNRQGVKLLGEGVVLTDSICTRISRSKWGDLFLANSPSEVEAALALIESKQLTAPPPQSPSAPLPSPPNPASSELATEGEPEPLIERAALSSIAIEPKPPEPPAAAPSAAPSVESPVAPLFTLGDRRDLPVHLPPDRESIRRRAALFKSADARVAHLQRLWADLPARIRSRVGSTPFQPREDAPSWPDASRVIALRRERTLRMRAVLAGLLAGAEVPLHELVSLASEMIRWYAAHPERFAQLALLPGRRDEDLPEQCYAAGALALATAARLGWPEAEVRLAALAGMLADVGMAAVPEELRNNARALNEIEINRVRRHPTLGVVLLESIPGLPEEVRRAAFEHQERENGSGYPRGLRSDSIADLSKVAAVATLFAAMTSRRSYRLTKRPYDALEDLIMLASAGALDRRVVRALVQAVGLFPVGSWVLLSNGSTGQVVAADPLKIDRPAVRVAGERSMTIWLSSLDPTDLSVVEAIDPPDSGPSMAADE